MDDHASPLVSLTDITRAFDNGTRALDGFDLTILQGETLALLGASGCGKSSLLRLLAGLDAHQAGRIDWHDAQAPDALSMVLQEPTLLPWATVAANVATPLSIRGDDRSAISEAVDEALTLVGLTEAAPLYPSQLSGGMKMRVSLARALVTKPRVLLLDEPFAALDEITRFRLNDELLALKERLGATVVFVTHSVFEASYIADRIAVMTGPPGQVVRVIDGVPVTERSKNFRESAAFGELAATVSRALREVA